MSTLPGSTAGQDLEHKIKSKLQAIWTKTWLGGAVQQLFSKLLGENVKKKMVGAGGDKQQYIVMYYGWCS